MGGTTHTCSDLGFVWYYYIALFVPNLQMGKFLPSSAIGVAQL